jgi:tetratricopeptide (TPR) repeat protein
MNPELKIVHREIWEALERESYATCLALVRLAVRANPDESVWQYVEGEVLRRLGRLSEAEAVLRRLHPLKEKNRDQIESGLAQIYAARGEMTLAEEWHRRAIATAPTKANPLIFFAAFLMRIQRIDEATALLTQAIDLQSDLTDEAYLNLARCHRAKEQYSEAAAGYRNALALSPDYLVARSELDDVQQLSEISDNFDNWLREHRMKMVATSEETGQ